MDLLLDTQILVWVGTGSKRLSPTAASALIDPHSRCYVSAVTAWEFVELNAQRRFGGDLDLASIIDQMELALLDYPADAWRLSASLPDLHRDPIDRMLIAHAIHADLTLVTADRIMRDYPVQSIW